MRNNAHPKLYIAWVNMRQRCNNTQNPDYKNYGGRGITYPKEWNVYENFLRDMQPSWYQGARLDREFNDKSYSKENCRWVSDTTSARNRDYVKVTSGNAEEIRQLYRTRKYSQRGLAKQFNLSKSTIGNIVRNEAWN
jgi:DNA-binding XRE family transcriptional regulator